MGLEELKRLPATPVNSPEMEAHKRSLAQHLFGNETRWAELTASPTIAAEVIGAQFRPPYMQKIEQLIDCESLLRAIQLVATGVLLDYHAWQRPAVAGLQVKAPGGNLGAKTWFPQRSPSAC